VQSLSNHQQKTAIIALFRVVNHHVGNLTPMPGASRIIRTGDPKSADCCQLHLSSDAA
jgi:hypothetical protein